VHGTHTSRDRNLQPPRRRRWSRTALHALMGRIERERQHLLASDPLSPRVRPSVPRLAWFERFADGGRR
jgi:hypothetical protein